MVDFGDLRVMACSPADLERWLREFTGDAHLKVGGQYCRLDAGGFMIDLSWQVLAPRRIALLRIEQLELRFVYPGEHAAAARRWISRFDRHTQRGGG